MIILKFALVIFLMAIAWAASNRMNPPPPVGGPIFYADAPVAWPLQPKYRLSGLQAYHSKRWIEADFDDRSLPLLARHMVGGLVGGRIVHQEQWRMVWLWDRQGRLRWRMREDPRGRILERQELF